MSEHVYALVGELSQRSPTKLDNNMTRGFIIADDAVVVVDTCASRAGAEAEAEAEAEAIMQAVKEVTNKPVLWAINSGGQGGAP